MSMEILYAVKKSLYSDGNGIFANSTLPEAKKVFRSDKATCYYDTARLRGLKEDDFQEYNKIAKKGFVMSKDLVTAYDVRMCMIRHSQKANCHLVYLPSPTSNPDGALIRIFTNRTILMGEELTLDYFKFQDTEVVIDKLEFVH